MRYLLRSDRSYDMFLPNNSTRCMKKAISREQKRSESNIRMNRSTTTQDSDSFVAESRVGSTRTIINLLLRNMGSCSCLGQVLGQLLLYFRFLASPFGLSAVDDDSGSAELLPNEHSTSQVICVVAASLSSFSQEGSSSTQGWSSGSSADIVRTMRIRVVGS